MTIAERIEKYQDHIGRGVKFTGEPIDSKELEKMDEESRFSFEEYVKLLELNSHAIATGVMSQEDGTYVYSLLGEGGPEKVNKAELSVRVVLLRLLEGWCLYVQG